MTTTNRPRVLATVPRLLPAFFLLILCGFLQAGQKLPTGVSAEGLRLWMRSDKEVLTSENRVDSWGDISGSGFVAEAVAGHEPLLVEERKAFGLPAIAFAGKEDALYSKVGLDMNMPVPFTFAIVLRPDDVWPKGIFSLNPADGKQDYESLNSFFFGHSRMGGEGSESALSFRQGHGTSAAIEAKAPMERGKLSQVIVTRESGSGDVLRFYVDGVLVEEKVSVRDHDEETSQSGGFAIGDRFPRGHPGLYGKSDIFEILVFGRVLKDEEIKVLSKYLSEDRR